MTGEHALVGERNPALDGLRGFAVLAIIADQVSFASGRSADDDLLAAVLGRLDFGVAIFVVLSGFLIYRPFATYRAPGDVRPGVARFWRRRALRIFPALWLTIAVTLLLTDRSESTSDWLRHLLLVQSVDFYYPRTELLHLWAISVGVGFYAVVPLLGWLASRRARDAGSLVRRNLAIVGLMTSIAVTFNVVQHHLIVHRPAQQWLPAYLDWFALGLLLAVLSSMPSGEDSIQGLRRTVLNWAAAPGSCWSVAGLLWLLTATQLGTPRQFSTTHFWQWTVQHLLYGVAAFFIVLPLALGGPDGRRVLGARVPRLMGTVSYGVFLWHLPVLLGVQRRLGLRPFGGDFPKLLALTTMGAVACASVSWLLLERPIGRYGSRPWRGMPARNVIATATTESV